MAALSARTRPLRAIRPDARVCWKVTFTGPSLGAILRPLAKQGSWYIDLELAAIIAKALHSISISEAPPQTTSARRHVAWALLALVCSARARTAISIFKNVYARDP
jgi:hypothetical protein